MAVTSLEVIKANLVLVGMRLLSAQQELDAFRLATGVDVQVSGAGLATNAQSGLTEPVLGLTLNRDRIFLELSPDRSTINRDYPLQEDLPRLAEVAWQAIKNTNVERQQVRAYGFNIELVFNQDSGTPAFDYLSTRIFDVGPLGYESWQFVGGSGKLIFDDNGRRWTIRLEPRFNQEAETRVFLDANLHVSKRSLPDESAIGASLKEIWDKIHMFTQRLDDRGGQNG